MFYRSDQLNFARAGVPRALPAPGVLYVGHPPQWGTEQVDAWIERNYHQASDDWDPSGSHGMVDDARLLFRTGLSTADADAPPKCVPATSSQPAR